MATSEGDRVPDYGTLPPESEELAYKKPFPVRRIYAAIAIIAAICLLQAASLARNNGQGNVSLLSIPDLSKEESDMAGLEGEVSDDLSENSVLSSHYKDTFAAKSADSSDKCHCDCEGHDPSFKIKAATMLDQIGENVFFGPCGGCPCMKSSSVDGVVANLRNEINEAEAAEKFLDSEEAAKIPVDIVMRVGAKGKNGAQGAKGFRGPDGDVGGQGPQGPTGPPGPKGVTGIQGPIGRKGPDGWQGPQGFQGVKGKPGIPGARGTEGIDGPRGSGGPAGSDGKNGPSGNAGVPGPRGDDATVGAAGEQGEMGPKGAEGDKGAIGEQGDQGFQGTNGPDGPKGTQGARGSRGPIGKGCDGVRPTDGTPPKNVDACGICGGDESECAVGRAGRTAHAVGDPHYLTFDGKSFDYQVAGEFILTRHMNDIEFQNLQVPCPNSRVRCNVGAAVITRNFNLKFLSEWRMQKIMVNGDMWEAGKEYHYGHRVQLNVFTSMLIHWNSFTVWFNDMAVGDGCYAYGAQGGWGPPLPNNLYMNLYFYAPGRWSSGLSMTGLFANYNYNYWDDWESISPSTMWWVKDTPNSAFSNPDYRLDWGNRITKDNAKMKTAGGAPMLSASAMAEGEVFHATKWTLEQEQRALKEVDPLSAKMRKRLFDKMAKDGAILRHAGEKKPEGLGAAELDIQQYPNERPDKLRIEQQMLFRKEWKKFSPVQRTSILKGKVASNNAVGMSQMCKQCIDGSQDCKDKKITKDPVAGVTWMAVNADGKDYTAKEREDACHQACLPDRPVTNVICKCWLDCSLGNPKETCRLDAHWNLVLARDIELIPKEGDGHCVTVDVASAARYKAAKYRPELWDKEDASNFVITLWYKPDDEKSCDSDSRTIHSILYKGPKEVDLANEPVAIEVDATMCDQASVPTLPIIATVAGEDLRSNGGISKTGWSFIAIMKKGKKVTLWIGTGDDVAQDSSMNLPDNVQYEAKVSDAIYLVSPEAQEPRIPYGWVGKMNYIPASLWDNEVPTIFGWKAPEDCGE